MDKIALVVFEQNRPEGVQKEYAYKTTLPLEEGDLAIVAVNQDGGTVFKVVKVEAVIEDTLENSAIVNQTKGYIVDKVDLEAHIKRTQAKERMTYIKGKLEEKKAQMEEIAVYEMLAKVDPEARKMLEEMKELTLNAQIV